MYESYLVRITKSARRRAQLVRIGMPKSATVTCTYLGRRLILENLVAFPYNMSICYPGIHIISRNTCCIIKSQFDKKNNIVCISDKRTKINHWITFHLTATCPFTITHYTVSKFIQIHIETKEWCPVNHAIIK